MSVDVFRAMQDNDTVSIRDLNEAKAGTGLNRTRSWHICKAVFSVLLSYAAIIIIKQAVGGRPPRYAPPLCSSVGPEAPSAVEHTTT